jgi:2-octaprenyl-6-methoxyphenol hydroxylase
LHPVAGQGSNLGLRDVATLAELVVDTLREGGDPGRTEVLERYDRWRRGDRRVVTWFTDGLVRVFSNRSLCLAAARDLGLVAMDVTPWLKGGLARGAMGLRGRLPRLSRGVPL